MQELKNERNQLFDENFKVKTDDTQKVINFCQKLSNITTIQCCTDKGYMYEYLPNIYKSVVNKDEV